MGTVVESAQRWISRSLVLLILQPGCSSVGRDPVVSDARVRCEEPGQLTIHCELEGDPDEQYDIDIAIAPVETREFSLKPTAIAGAWTKGVAPNKDLEIRWDLTKEPVDAYPPGRYICRVGARARREWHPVRTTLLLGAAALATYWILNPPNGEIEVEVPAAPVGSALPLGGGR